MHEGNNVMKVLFFILVLAAIIASRFFLSKEYFKIAEDKGYNSRRYYNYCLLFGIAAYILIAAMPDRSPGNVIRTEELPEL